MLLIMGPDPFIPQSSQGHSPKLIFHIMKSRDQTSVLLSVTPILNQNLTLSQLISTVFQKNKKMFEKTKANYPIIFLRTVSPLGQISRQQASPLTQTTPSVAPGTPIAPMVPIFPTYMPNQAR